MMQSFYQKYQVYFPVVFFAGGFLLDLLTTDRIDQQFSLWQQFVYLLLIHLIIFLQVTEPEVFRRNDRLIAKMWKYNREILHFLFGSLLSLYAIFYFKSASLLTSFSFMSLLVVLLVINELPKFQALGFAVRSALTSLCLCSYLIYLVPVMTGEIGWLSFGLSLILGGSLSLLFYRGIQQVSEDKRFVQDQFILPGLAIPLLLLCLYFFRQIPPVPLSLKHIGIYHTVEKEGARFKLSYDRPWGYFWQSGAQSFLAREGDKVHCFFSVFSPARFRDQLQMAWYKAEKSGWVLRDSVPVRVNGGRDQGFRGFSMKSNYEPGAWQVRIMTSDHRELGRISLDISSDQSKDQRQFAYDYY